MNDEPICYITYAVPAKMLSEIMPFPAFSKPLPDPTPENPLYPDGFMPEWFLRGSFPEDDLED